MITSYHIPQGSNIPKKTYDYVDCFSAHIQMNKQDLHHQKHVSLL